MLINVKEEGVKLLREAQSNIVDSFENIKVITKDIKDTITRYGSFPHSDEIIEILDNIEKTNQEATPAGIDIASRLGNIAEAYEHIFNTRLD